MEFIACMIIYFFCLFCYTKGRHFNRSSRFLYQIGYFEGVKAARREYNDQLKKYSKICCENCSWFVEGMKACSKNEGYCNGEDTSKYYCSDFNNFRSISSHLYGGDEK